MQEQIQDIPLNERFDPGNFVGEDVDDSTYQRQPVENFGLSLLESMGWSEERGVGKNSEYALKNFITPTPRIARQGLGADPKPIFKNKREKELYENHQKQQMQKKGLLIEKDQNVKIKSGKHKGLTGIVLSVSNQNQINQQLKECFIQLNINDQIIKSYQTDLELIEKQDIKNRSRSRSPKIHPIQQEVISKQLQDDYNNKPSQNESSIPSNRQKITISWIQPNLRVRIINKSLKYYNSKVTIHDIIDSNNFSNFLTSAVVSESGELIENLKEKDLETLIPSLQGRVKVLKGMYQKQIGTLQSKDKKKGTAVIMLEENYELVEYKLDDICDFVEF